MYMKNVEMDASIRSLASIKAAGYMLPAKVVCAIEQNICILKKSCEEYCRQKEEAICANCKNTEDGQAYLDFKDRNTLNALNSVIENIGLLEHDVNIFKVPIEDFFNAEIPIADISKLMFMIE